MATSTPSGVGTPPRGSTPGPPAADPASVSRCRGRRRRRLPARVGDSGPDEPDRGRRAGREAAALTFSSPPVRWVVRLLLCLAWSTLAAAQDGPRPLFPTLEPPPPVVLTPPEPMPEPPAPIEVMPLPEPTAAGIGDTEAGNEPARPFVVGYRTGRSRRASGAPARSGAAAFAAAVAAPASSGPGTGGRRSRCLHRTGREADRHGRARCGGGARGSRTCWRSTGSADRCRTCRRSIGASLHRSGKRATGAAQRPGPRLCCCRQGP